MTERIRILGAELADQIAAGEVVERPASVVKELVENAIDAGAKRVEVELEDAGLARIVVRDDGRGIHPEDLVLSITRHATSKLSSVAELLDVPTLGFRGEALASIAAVAQVVIESRLREASAGTRMRARPGLPPELEPVGMPVGTRIEVLRLFGNVPARRKFMRAEATEVGHCSETMLKIALSHPGVHLRLRHGARELLDLPAASFSERVEQVLARRTRDPLRRISGERDGIRIEAYLAPAAAAAKSRGSLYIIVRHRVVRERALAQIVSAALGDALPAGRHPIGCLIVDPPARTVDVNVHPQKAEVRFSDPQRVYAAARQVLETASSPEPQPEGEAVVRRFGGALQGEGTSTWRGTLDARRSTLDGYRTSVGGRPGSGASLQAPYVLRTRAASDGYAGERARLREEATALRQTALDVGVEPEPEAAPARSLDAAQPLPDFTLLTCLPGPLALVRYEDDILAVDLRALRSHLVYRRLVQDIGGGDVQAQGLLQPAVIELPPADVALCVERNDDLAGLGLVVEAFGEDALLVRAVPAHLRDCVEEPDVADLVHKILPWMRVRDRDRDDALRAMAATAGADPAPRLARRWLRELLADGVELAATPGIRRFTAKDLGLGS